MCCEKPTALVVQTFVLKITMKDTSTVHVYNAQFKSSKIKLKYLYSCILISYMSTRVCICTQVIVYKYIYMQQYTVYMYMFIMHRNQHQYPQLEYKNNAMRTTSKSNGLTVRHYVNVYCACEICENQSTWN